MRALVVTPGVPSSARVIDIAEPRLAEADLLIAMRAVGICGTDREIIRGDYGLAPPGDDYLIIGHESLGEVLEAPRGSDFKVGDLVVGIVRRPDPIPCSSCAVGEWDMCRNGLFTERGIKARHGFCSDRFWLEPDFAVRVDLSLGDLGVLLEPASILAKAWEQAERIGQRTQFEASRVLVTGAGPIGLLAALMGRQRGYEVHVLDRVTSGAKPQLVRDLDAQYHTGTDSLEPLRNRFDLVFECTGASPLVLEVLAIAGPNCVTCLSGISSGHRVVEVDLDCITRSLVLENGVVFGSVNANRTHYDLALKALLEADRSWLARLITRRVPLSCWHEAMQSMSDDVKVVITPD